MKHFNVRVLTTNYDELIEEAFLPSDPKEILHHLHGALSDMDSARFTANSVFQPLNDRERKRAREFLSKRTLLVAGYSGMDEFDIMPVLFDPVYGPNKVIWVCHPGDVMDDSATRHFNCIPTRVLPEDIDSLLFAVYKETSNASNQDPELDTWTSVREINDDPTWWLKDIKMWWAELKRADPTRVRYLWATFADHLRLYRMQINGSQRNLADEAYRSVAGTPGLDKATSLDVAARVAYIKRTVGGGDTAIEELDKTISDVDNAIRDSTSDEEKNNLKKVLGWAIHQQGIACQGMGDYSRAKAKFEQAVSYRRSIRDPELPYSIFQHFMNAYQAAKHSAGTIDAFALPNWRNTLARKLDKFAKSFKKSSEAQHYAYTRHNIGFVYQRQAEEKELVRDYAGAGKYSKKALKEYLEAMDIRRRLRDPRMIAQSLTRIAECWIRQARIDMETRTLIEDEIEKLLNRAEQYLLETKDIYQRIPQEQFRDDDVKRGLAEIERLRNKLEDY
jgi:tetratricopeptide (TPR) repeat protein